MAVHKDCYAPIGLIQQRGPRRRETEDSTVSHINIDKSARIQAEIEREIGTVVKAVKAN
jgi:hypothetical protein